MIILGTIQLILLLVAAVAIVATCIALHLTVFYHMKLKRKVKELTRNFEYLHALINGQDAQFIKRLELISRTNLLYVDIHMKYNKRYKDLKDITDAEAQNQINILKDLVSAKDYKQLKVSLSSAKQILDSYDLDVNNLNNDLVNVIKPEEDCRQASLSCKEKLRLLKQDYFIKQTELSLISDSFETLFSNLEKCFGQFESYVESAQYDEAKNLLFKIEEVIKETSKIFPQLPSMCTTITSIIPEKIQLMNERYEEMLGKKYPLTHLMVKTSIEEMNNQLTYLTRKLQSFDLTNVNEQLDGILTRIDDFIEQFDSEESAKEIFDRDCSDIYEKTSNIEKRFIKLCNLLPDLKKIFNISEVQQSNISTIRDQINKMGATKRSLDTFIHSGNLQPYTVLVSKMNLLNEETIQCEKLLDEFHSYLNTLKGDSESNLDKIKKFHSELKSRYNIIMNFDVYSLKERYISDIEANFKIIDNCFTTLTSSPIDVNKANLLINELTTNCNELFSKIDKDLSDAKASENAIVYANRDRMHLNDLNQLLKQTEDLYYKSEFAISLEETNKILQSIKSGETSK